MKAIVCTKSGPPEVLQLKEVEKPIPKDNEVLVKVHAATVTIGDVFVRKLPSLITLPLGILFGFKRKKIPGHELAGVIESVGKDVKRFRKGDQVLELPRDLVLVPMPNTYVCLKNGSKGCWQ